MAALSSFCRTILFLSIFSLFGTLQLVAQHYTITTTDSTIVVTDIAGNAETMTVSEIGNSIRFLISGRTYSLNGGFVTPFYAIPPDIDLTGIKYITINMGAGNDGLNIDSFTLSLPNLTLNGGTGDDVVNFMGNITFANNANLNVDLQNDDAAPGSDAIYVYNGADIILSGTGALDFNVSKNIAISANAVFRTQHGNLTMSGNGTSAVSSSYYGIDATAASILIESTGTGQVSLYGRGGNLVVTNERNHGVVISSTSTIRGGTVGTLTINGQGGNSNSQGDVGIGLSGSITTLGANISITGSGGTTGYLYNHGIVMGNVTVSAGGSGTVTIVGNGGYTGDNRNNGLVISSGTLITSAGGNVSVTGTGGSWGLGIGGYNYGIYMTGGTITAGGNGSVTVSGRGGTTSDEAGPNCDGIYFSGATITSSGGPVSVTGTSAPEPQSNGINMLSGTISAGGTGTLNIVGVEGVYGIYSAGTISASGNITINSNGVFNPAINLVGASITNNGAGSSTSITANTLSVGGAVNITTTATGTLNLNQYTNGNSINVGGADIANGTLGLSDAELDRALTPTPNIVIGNANTGALTISAAVSRSYQTNLTLFGNAIVPSYIGTDVNLAGGTLTLGTGSKLNIDIDGTVADTLYKQLNVAGQVNLNNAVLTFTGSTHVPALGQSFTLVNNDGTDAVSGIFNGLPQGGVVGNFLGTMHGAQISYTGGTGNDVVITIIPLQNWYLDADNDSRYVAGPVSAYISPGPGYNTTATISGDCNDNDNTKWQMLNAYVDADGDGYTVGNQISVCSGAGVPLGYSAATSGTDCNDNNAAIQLTQTWYLDADNDGHYTAVQNICNSPGNGWTLTPGITGDCNDNDNTTWQIINGYTDADGDGYTVGGQTSICSGATLPNGYVATSLGTDCNDNNAQVHVIQTWYLDADNDGHYLSSLASCGSPGAGYNTTATISGDCNDNDNTKWQQLNGYVDADGDGYTIGGQVSVCSGATLPNGYAATSLGTDCNDNNSTITTASQTWYLDADNDGYYTSSQIACASPGNGWNLTATINGDCDDNDNTAWQQLSGYIDADGDGYTIGSQVSVCSGAALPNGYAATSLGTDCNDNNAAATVTQTWYLDADNDGYYTSSQNVCASPGNGWNLTATINGDCDDNDNIAWQQLSGYVDVDGDGYTIGSQVSVCSGAALPNGYAATSLGTDCNDNNSTITTASQTWYLDADNDGYYTSSQIVCASPGNGWNLTATINGDCDDNDNTAWQQLNGYVDADGDGYTIGSQVSVCSGANLPNGYVATSLGADCDDNNATASISQTWYLDADNDGYYTSSQAACTSPGIGWTTAGTSNGDCTDLDDTKWQELSGYIDSDGDGYTVGTQVNVCTGASLPNGYAATSLGEDCNDNDATILGAPCNPNGIDEANGEILAVKLYPNPTENVCSITFDLKQESTYNLQLQNAIGDIIWTKQLIGKAGENLMQINLEGLSAGMYIVGLRNDNSKLNLRILKQ